MRHFFAFAAGLLGVLFLALSIGQLLDGASPAQPVAAASVLSFGATMWKLALGLPLLMLAWWIHRSESSEAGSPS